MVKTRQWCITYSALAPVCMRKSSSLGARIQITDLQSNQVWRSTSSHLSSYNSEVPMQSFLYYEVFLTTHRSTLHHGSQVLVMASVLKLKKSSLGLMDITTFASYSLALCSHFHAISATKATGLLILPLLAPNRSFHVQSEV